MARRGLVLGAGGVLGLTWIVLALRRLELQEGWDPRTAEAMVGTSAGSITAALLGAGFSTQDLLSWQRHGDLPGVRWTHVPPSGPRPPKPRLAPSSPSLALSGLLRFRSPLAAAVGLMPRGREPMPGLRAMLDAVLDGRNWVEHRRTCAVAMDLATGRRVAFGRPDHPPARMTDAVLASCAIPGWFEPVRIGGRDYVDGGARSSTNADLLSREGLDEIIVVAPLTSSRPPPAASTAEAAERLMRRRMSYQLDREVARLRAAGTAVRRIEPTIEDLGVMGPNFMDPRRRGALLRLHAAA